ncbi:MAG: HD domain-containing phosphohydrolase [Phycisphaerae bacterium]
MRKRVLIVDDDALNVEILEEILGDMYETASADSGEACLDRMCDFGPDVVLLDIMMPGIDGYETCRRIKAAPEGTLTQVILVSAKASTQERLEGYDAGADDYLAKPFDQEELLAKVRVQFRLRGVLTELAGEHARVQVYSEHLEDLVRERTAEVIATRDVAVFALAKLAESRDPETGEHLHRIRSYCRILGEQLHRRGPYTDEIDDQFIEYLDRASPLHDIGKVGIPDVILLKPGRLTTSEFEIMQRHAAIGADALAEAAGRSGCGGFLAMAAEVARSHHERFDGTGYPDGLRGRRIPLSARIVALADVYDALTSVRVYKAAYEPEVARLMIERESGRHFDPAVVDAFLHRHDDFLRVRGLEGDGARALVATGESVR